MPVAPSDHTLAGDKVGIEKEKEKVSEDAPIITRTYPTRGTHRKLLSDAMAASKSKATKKIKLRRTTMVDDEKVPDDQLVDVDTEIGNCETEFDEDLFHLKLHTKITKFSSKGLESSKNPKTQKKGKGNSKRNDPAPTRGPGSQVKRQRVEKVVTKEESIRLLEKQKV